MNTLEENDGETGSRDEALLNEATDWLICLSETEPHPDDPYAHPDVRKQAFLSWVRQSPRHLHVFMEVLDLDCRLRDLRAHPILDVVEDAVRPAAIAPMETERLRTPRHRLLFAAAAISVVVAVTVGTRYMAVRNIPVPPIAYSTSVGQQKSFTLSDGSVMSLNTDTQVEVSISKSARDIRLIRGETYLRVVHDPRRTLTVSTDHAYVRDLGTDFGVQTLPEGLRVIVASGEVEAGINGKKNASREAKILSAGQSATISSGQVHLTDVDVNSALAWKDHRLVFHEDQLAFVADQFNRYNVPQMRVEGTTAKGTLVSGSYDLNSYEEILKFARTKHLTVIQDGNDWVIRSKT